MPTCIAEAVAVADTPVRVETVPLAVMMEFHAEKLAGVHVRYRRTASLRRMRAIPRFCPGMVTMAGASVLASFEYVAVLHMGLLDDTNVPVTPIGPVPIMTRGGHGGQVAVPQPSLPPHSGQSEPPPPLPPPPPMPIPPEPPPPIPLELDELPIPLELLDISFPPDPPEPPIPLPDPPAPPIPLELALLPIPPFPADPPIPEPLLLVFTTAPPIPPVLPLPPVSPPVLEVSLVFVVVVHPFRNKAPNASQ